MNTRIKKEKIPAIIKKALEVNILSKNFESAIFFDLDKISGNISDFKRVFPSRTLHAIAAKTNPLTEILIQNRDEDVGFEAASIEEVKLALHLEYLPSKVVFDSPVKTVEDIKYALSKGVHINIDSISELNRVKGIIDVERIRSCSIGIRINPQIGAGNIKSLSVGEEFSKFGVSLKENKDYIYQFVKENKWINCLHVHSGSQGLSLEKITEGVKKVYLFAEEINSSLGEQVIKKIDVGGGLPIAYRENENTPQVGVYARLLSEKCPKLFDNYQLITEFGRYVYGHAGFTVSKVEYLKKSARKNVALTHVGADLFLRRCYNPQDWYHSMIALKADFSEYSSNNLEEYTIGGPLCFAGDILARDIKLPALEEGDYLIIQDTGANCVNLWSRHCNRRIPSIIGYRGDGKHLKLIKKQESFSDVINFWS